MCLLRLAWRSLSLGPTAKWRGEDELLWGDLEVRVRLCPSTPPPDVFHLREGHCLEDSFSPPHSRFLGNYLGLACQGHSIPRQSSDPTSRSEVGRKHHYLALGPWGSHSSPLGLSVPPIEWRVAILLRVGPPTNCLVDTAPLQRQVAWGLGLRVSITAQERWGGQHTPASGGRACPQSAPVPTSSVFYFKA